MSRVFQVVFVLRFSHQKLVYILFFPYVPYDPLISSSWSYPLCNCLLSPSQHHNLQHPPTVRQPKFHVPSDDYWVKDKVVPVRDVTAKARGVGSAPLMSTSSLHGSELSVSHPGWFTLQAFIDYEVACAREPTCTFWRTYSANRNTVPR